MIQIIAQRGDKGQYWGLTNPIIRGVPSITAALKQHAEILSRLDSLEHINLFYTLAHHAGADSSERPIRTSATFEMQTVLAFDIDHADTSRAYDYLALVANLLECPAESLTLINSGNGLHILLGLKHPIRNVEYFVKNKTAYVEFCAKLHSRMIDAGLMGEPDRRVFDPARILRLPGTINKKQGAEEKRCELLQFSDVVLDIDLRKITGIERLEQENISPAEIRRNFPKPDFAEIVKECRFVGKCLSDINLIHEPQAFDLYSLFVNMAPTDKVEFQGADKSAYDIAKWVAENATASASLTARTFGVKWEQAKKYGCRKCTTIAEHLPEICHACPHFGKIPTPLALKSPEHIGSAGAGYWVMTSRGQYLHPHYADLAKVYTREQSFVVDEDERMFAFTGKQYNPVAKLPIKAWVERKVVPSEPLREHHRNEFLTKIKATGSISAEQEEELFVSSTRGKLNCLNGVVDIRSGELQAHHPSMGFRYCLPYDYTPGLVSELFLDWLDTICMSDLDTMEAILDMMAYILWPHYDDHVFFFIVGDGSNGKSTLIHLIQTILGPASFSTVGISQLTRNRFAPATLDGKLANLSEESSGVELDYEQLNILKNLSAGGSMFVEHKGEHGFTLRNDAKLIFSANKPPRFMEHGEAISRRVSVIPFDYKIVNKDSRVEASLLNEAPSILSMLVARIQKNTQRHGGRFIVNRGGAESKKATIKLLTVGNTAIEWAQENLETSDEMNDDQYIFTDDAYTYYRRWCETNGYRYPLARKSFSQWVRNYFVTPVAKKDMKKRKTGQGNTTYQSPQAVFCRTRFKEGVV